MQNIHSTRSGSTLLEVLVVTGLIALMIAQLLPAVQKSSDNAVSRSVATSKVRGSIALKHHRPSVQTVKL